MFGKLRILLWSGIVLLFVPLFGVSHTVKNILVALIGIGIIYLAFSIRYAYKKVLYSLRETTPHELHHE